MPLNKILVVVGVILSTIGIFGAVLSIVAVPYTTTTLEHVPHSEIWLDESFEVPSFSWLNWHSTGSLVPSYSLRTMMRLTFESTGGGIDFKVMNQTNFAKFNSSQSYEYYTLPSRFSATSLNITWTPPTDTVIHFVWDNHDSAAKPISARFLFEWTEWENVQVTENRTLLPSQDIYYGILMFIVGIAVIGYGLVKPSPSTGQSPPSQPQTQPSANENKIA
jgi:hypothetical protein